MHVSLHFLFAHNPHTHTHTHTTVCRVQGGAVASIDVGSNSPLNTELLMDGYHEVCTVLESDLGHTVLADVYYLEELGGSGRLPPHRVFVVPRGL